MTGSHIISHELIEISRGLAYLHSENVVHGDLKCVRICVFAIGEV